MKNKTHKNILFLLTKFFSSLKTHEFSPLAISLALIALTVAGGWVRTTEGGSSSSEIGSVSSSSVLDLLLLVSLIVGDDVVDDDELSNALFLFIFIFYI